MRLFGVVAEAQLADEQILVALARDRQEIVLPGEDGRQVEIRGDKATIGRNEAEHRHVRDILGEVLEIGMDGLVRGYLLPIAAAEALGDAIEHQLVGLEDLEGMLVDGVGGARQLRLRLLEAPLVIEPGGGSEQDQRQDDDGRKEELERPRRSGPALHRKSLHQCSGKL